jgi:hypothetical protein
VIGGEGIIADKIQMYTGLDIATNKNQANDQGGISEVVRHLRAPHFHAEEVRPTVVGPSYEGPPFLCGPVIVAQNTKVVTMNYAFSAMRDIEVTTW